MNEAVGDVNILPERNVYSNEDFTGITLAKRGDISGLVDRFVILGVLANFDSDL